MNLPEYSADSVFGHYVHKKGVERWEPLVDQSRELFRAVVADDHLRVEEEVRADPSKAQAFYILLYWGSSGEGGEGGKDANKTNVTVKQRTLLMLAAYHGCLRVVSTLVVNGAIPRQLSADGLSAYQMALSGNHPCAPTVVAYLRESEGLTQNPSSDVEVLQEGDKQTKEQPDKDLAAINGNGASGMPPDDPNNCSELTKPEYSTDHFRMLCFKVLRCMKRSSHDWRCCPFAHSTENARRRDPTDYRYCSISCPDYKRGFCIRGDSCPYAHGIYESWLHPSRYRTQLCKDGKNCKRPVCFFSHSVEELRAPTHNWVPTSEDLKDANESVVMPMAVPGSDTDRLNKKMKQKTKKSALSALAEEHLKAQDPAEEVAGKNRVVAPRMSNAFARRHGLNPKDDPSMVLHKMSSSTGFQLVAGSEMLNALSTSNSIEEQEVSKPAAAIEEQVLPWATAQKTSPTLINGTGMMSKTLNMPVPIRQQHHHQQQQQQQLQQNALQTLTSPQHQMIPMMDPTRQPAMPMQMPMSLPNALHSPQFSIGGLSLHSSHSPILTPTLLVPELQEEALIDARLASQQTASPYGDGSGISLLGDFSGNFGSYSDASSQWFGGIDEQNPVNTFPGTGSFWLPQRY